jgi:CubicO group peptidase (beta-lactamase class C family)
MPHVTRLLTAAVVCALLAPGADAKTAEGDLGRRLDTYLSGIVPFGFSGAVLVAESGEVVLDGGYGLAIRSSATSNTDETVFSTGSLTKQFTAAAILNLEMKGRLETGDAITEFFGEVPADKRGITLHHLLTHTAGLPGSSGFDFDEAGRDDTVRRILETPLEFDPGTEMSYSNCGYTLLAAVVELVSGRPYEQFLSAQLFGPAGMEWTGYRLPDWDSRVVAHNYVGDADNGRHLDRPYPYWNLVGNGGILSTTGDMHRWYAALKGDRVLSAAAKKKLWTPFLNEYAYGWDVIGTDDGDTLIRHDGGSMMGNSAVMGWFVQKDALYVIFCNQSYGRNPLFEVIEEKVRAIVAGVSFDVPQTLPANRWSVANLRRYEGTFELPGGGRVATAVQNGALELTASDQSAIDALLFPYDSAAANNAGLNGRTRALVEAAISGDASPFETELGTGGRAPRFRRAIERQARRVEMMTEERVTGVVVVGTVPSLMDGVVATGVRFQTPSGERGRLSLLWREGRLVGLDQLMFAPAVPFVPAPGGEGAFAGYHLVWAKGFTVQFRRDGERVTGVDLGGGVIATRTR